MANFRVIKLNLAKIPEDKIFKTEDDKKYIDLVVWDKKAKDQYGNDCSVSIAQKKEERGKAPIIYVGNGIIPSKQQGNQQNNNSEEDLPF